MTPEVVLDYWKTWFDIVCYHESEFRQIQKRLSPTRKWDYYFVLLDEKGVRESRAIVEVCFM